MYTVIQDDSPAAPTTNERIDFLMSLKIGQCFDLPLGDQKAIRHAIGKIHEKNTGRRYTCGLKDDRKHYRCKRVS